MVSVIIPLYNREGTIGMAVNSVLRQTYRDIEVIVVDDGSKDRSLEVVKNIDDERIRIIECEKNGGACIARNLGIENAIGDFIAFQDSDDFWHEDKLEKSIYYLKEKNVDFVFSAVYRKGERGFAEDGRIVPSYNLNHEKDKFGKILSLNCVSTQTIVARREVFERVRFDSGLPRFQDWDLAIQVVKSAFRVYYISEPLVDCYILDDSITSDSKKAIYALEKFEQKYRKDFLDNPRAAEEFYFRSAHFLEKQGYSGAAYFVKAYKIGKNQSFFMRYILAKVRIYMPLCRAYEKIVNMRTDSKK